MLLILMCLQTARGEESTFITVNGGYRGRIFGCDCPGGQTGSIAHRAAALVDKFNGHIPLGLDAGGVLDLDPNGGARRSRCALIGLGNQGVRVLGVTPRDLFYGREFLESAASQADIQLVSANIVYSQDSSLIFQPWSAHLLPQFNVAVTALADFQPGRRFSGASSWRPLPPESVLSALRETVPTDATFLVLLTDIGEGKLRELIPKLPGFDLIVTSSRLVVTANPIIIGSTTVIHPRTDGKTLDYVRIPSKAGERIKYYSLPLSRTRRADQKTEKWMIDCLENPEN